MLRVCFRIEDSLLWYVEHIIYQLVMFTKQLQMNFLFGFQPLHIIPDDKVNLMLGIDTFDLYVKTSLINGHKFFGLAFWRSIVLLPA